MLLMDQITVDLKNPYPLTGLKAHQGDTGRGVLISLFYNGQIMEPTTETVRIFIKKPDKTKVYNDCQIENGKIKAIFTNQALAAAGRAEVEIEMTGTENRVSTPIFALDILPTNIDDTAIESTNEFTAIEKVVNAAIDEAVERADAETQAAVDRANAAIAAANEAAENASRYGDKTLEIESLERQQYDAIDHLEGDGTVGNPNSSDAPLSIGVYGKSVQDATTGAQLLDMDNAKGGTSAGITSTINPDGTITDNGTASTAVINIWFFGSYNVTPADDGSNVFFTLEYGKTYHIHDILLFSVGPSGSPISAGGLFTCTQVDGFKVTGVRHTVAVIGESCNDKILYPMVAEVNNGEQAIPWEPYTGGVPSPSPAYPQPIQSVGGDSGVTLKVSGAQLLDAEADHVSSGIQSYTVAGDTITIPGELCGLPVDSHGNYTDRNGQQWICDTVEVSPDGTAKITKRVNKVDPTKFTFNRGSGRFETNVPDAYSYDTSIYMPVRCNIARNTTVVSENTCRPGKDENTGILILYAAQDTDLSGLDYRYLCDPVETVIDLELTGPLKSYAGGTTIICDSNLSPGVYGDFRSSVYSAIEDLDARLKNTAESMGNGVFTSDETIAGATFETQMDADTLGGQAPGYYAKQTEVADVSSTLGKWRAYRTLASFNASQYTDIVDAGSKAGSVVVVQRAQEMVASAKTIVAARCYDGYIRVWADASLTGAFAVDVIINYM
ncbi:phage baseplate upper protein [Lacrimispora sp. NSJ-141]|uniref:Phage baseplate upper protein n=1 Tax=Lientehia hominis TaxID=2897778 RepID=A0AAP2WAQ7_9FIRM|nr:BppU family phage baseplate upper protein [Lientehia hominis]MCD2493752.1 phage baseplate upper protein [Lientehia hominis]